MTKDGMPLSPAAAVRHFHAQLRAVGSPEVAAREKAYLNSALRFHGLWPHGPSTR
jgi:hypothetical protein